MLEDLATNLDLETLGRQRRPPASPKLCSRGHQRDDEDPHDDCDEPVLGFGGDRQPAWNPGRQRLVQEHVVNHELGGGGGASFKKVAIERVVSASTIAVRCPSRSA